MITNGLDSLEKFLENWSEISSVIISLITSFFVPLLIYQHQRGETNEGIRQSIVSVIEEAEEECNAVKQIADLCEQAQNIDTCLGTLSSKDDYVKVIQIAKKRLSEFKTVSIQLPSTDKIRKFDTVLIQNRDKKILITKRGKKIKVKRLEELLSSIYESLETNHQLRVEVINKIPESDVLTVKEANDSGTQEVIALENIRYTFAALASSLSDLKYNSDFIIETWENLKSQIY